MVQPTWWLPSTTSSIGELGARVLSFSSYSSDLYPSSFKQNQRAERFASLPPSYGGPLTAQQKSILSKPIVELVQDVQNNITSPIDILRTYGKTTRAAHARTNCVTELLLPDAESWSQSPAVNLKGPLAGIPISLKDSIAVGGFDVTVGYSMHVNKPYAEDGIMVKLLKRAGAIPHAKTALPITLLSFESTNSVWGVAKNPHNTKYSPGAALAEKAPFWPSTDPAWE